MANRYAVETVFTAIDNMTAPLRKMEASCGRLGGVGKAVSNKLKNDLKAAERSLNNFGSGIVRTAKYAVAGAVAAVGVGLTSATKSFIEFDSALHSAGAAFSDIDANAANFEDQLVDIGKAARDVAAVTEFNAKSTADAMATLARAGVDSTNSIALLPGVADLATAASVDLNDAVGMAVGGLNTLGLMTNVPEDLAKNMAYMSDIMAYTADSANMSLTDVSEAIKQGGSFFTTANNDITTLSAALTALANRSIVGAEAGVHLRNIMTNLSSPTAEAARVMDELGINVVDSNGNLMNLTNIVDQLNGAMVDMGDAEKNAILYSLFGKQNLAAANALLLTGKDALDQYGLAASNSMGAAATKAGAMRQSLQNQIEVLKSGLTELGFKFVEAFRTRGSEGLLALTQAVENFDPTNLINGAIAIFDKIVAAVKVMWDLRGVIMVVMGVILTYKTIIGAVVLAMKLWNAIQILSKVGMIAWNGIMALSTGLAGGFKIAMAALNAVFVASPIGWIILGIVAAIAAVVAIVVVCVKHWDDITAAVGRFIDKAKNFLIPILDAITAPFKKIGEAFKNGGFVAGIKQIGVTLLKWVLKPVQGLLKLLSKIPGIGDTFGGWNDNIDKWIDGLMYDGSASDSTAAANTSVSSSVSSSTSSPTAATPVTAGDRVAYTENRSVSESRMTIGVEKGVSSYVTGNAPGITVQTGYGSRF